MNARRISLGEGTWRHLPPEEASGGSALQDLDEASKWALQRASELGFVRAGIASTERFEEPAQQLREFLAEGRAGEMGYLAHGQADGSLTRDDPQHLLAGVRAALVVAIPYPAPLPIPSGKRRSGPRARVAAYAQGQDYHLVVKERLLLLADSLAEHLGTEVVARACVDSAPLLERDLARRAGFAFLGKNTLAIAPGAGSHFLLGELLLKLPLTPSSRPLADGCGSCTACLDACPTQAFVGPHQLDATRCISYLTIESRGPIPVDLRRPLGDHLFGCDDCQAVCPYNASGAHRPFDDALRPRPQITELDAAQALRLTSSGYKRLVKGSALRRVSRNQLARNAAIVLGNSGVQEAVAPLFEQALSHPSSDVRLHCVWALGELLHTHGLSGAEQALLSLCSDQHNGVAAEAEICLDSAAFEKPRGSHSSPDAHGNEGKPTANP